MEDNSTLEWQGSSSQCSWGQMLMFPHREAKSFPHLSAFSAKKCILDHSVISAKDQGM